MSDHFTNYLTLEYMKNSVGVSRDNTKHDDKLLELIFDANQEIDKVLTPYADDIPVDPGTSLFINGRKLATMYARSLWFKDINQLDLAKVNSEEYEQKKQSLFDSLKAQRTSRTRTVLLTSDPRNQKLPLPSQQDIFILDNY